ncbi:hypothetical protein [Streptomyces noursei]|uniref:hypothetical protein n=1 Tax=Streptomyces noursei TaxID=1971 RepID=UPI00381C61FE
MVVLPAQEQGWYFHVGACRGSLIVLRHAPVAGGDDERLVLRIATRPLLPHEPVAPAEHLTEVPVGHLDERRFLGGLDIPDG